LANKTGPIVIISKDGGSTWGDFVDFRLDKTDRIGADDRGTYSLWLNRDGSQSVICRQPGICWINSAPPKLLGSGVVGALLAVDVGVWDSEVKLSYQWLRDGVAIDQATNSSYLVAPADLGSKISVSVTGSRAGFAQVSRVSSVIGATEGVMSLTPVPRVSGSGVVGTVVAADVGVWDSGVMLSYQWFRGSDPIFQETLSTHVVSREDAGKSLSVQVSVAKPGYKSVTMRSEPTSANLITFTNPTQPKLVGVPKVGNLLKVVTGNWGRATSISYKWLLDGKTLIGQNGLTLRILSKFKGHAIRAIVTQTCNACQSVSLTSTKLFIRR
jgi:hypothetical protein